MTYKETIEIICQQWDRNHPERPSVLEITSSTLRLEISGVTHGSSFRPIEGMTNEEVIEEMCRTTFENIFIYGEHKNKMLLR